MKLLVVSEDGYSVTVVDGKHRAGDPRHACS